MKKLLLAAALLVVVVYAQAPWLTTDHGTDTLAIRINFRMVGVQWSLDTLADGIYGESPSFSAANYRVSAVDTDTLAWTYVAADDSSRPCDSMFQCYWLENTGGLALEFMVCRNDVGNCADSFLVWESLSDSIPNCYNRYITTEPDGGVIGDDNALVALCVEFMMADDDIEDIDVTDLSALVATRTGGGSTPDEDNMIEFGTGSGHVGLEDWPTMDANGAHLPAEDPANVGDGEYCHGTGVTETDQMEMYIFFGMPASALTKSEAFFYIYLRAKITDAS